MHACMYVYLYIYTYIYIWKLLISLVTCGATATATATARANSGRDFGVAGCRQLAAASWSETVPFGNGSGQLQCRYGRCRKPEKKHVPLHPLAFTKGINARLDWSKALQKLMFAALWRHPSLSKVNFSMKTIKIQRENEGPAHEPRIFTCRSMFRWTFLQIYCVLLRKERVFLSHFCDASETRINHWKNV